MFKINFNIHCCGMSCDLFSEKIMIYKPLETYTHLFDFDKETIANLTVSELIGLCKRKIPRYSEEYNLFNTSNVDVENLYIKKDGTLFRIMYDRTMIEIFRYFELDELEVVGFYVVGGASFHCSGYQFIVHPKEEIHRNKPHVHVRYDDYSPRYSLDTLERFPGDKVCRKIIKDEKRIIIPYIKANKEMLYQYWNHYMNGYQPPAIDDKGKQYYKES